MSELRKSLGFPTLIVMGTAGVLGTSWIYTNGEFLPPTAPVAKFSD